jgi:predicted nucleotidyltransferase
VSFASILRGLTDQDVRFVVVGGIAAAALGSVIVTNDIDICYETATENVLQLARLLAQWQAYPRGIETGLSFFMDERIIRATPLMSLQTTEGAIDLLDYVLGVGDYAAVVACSESVSAFGVNLRVLSLEALIRAKRAAGRAKDLAQRPELEALQALRTNPR